MSNAQKEQIIALQLELEAVKAKLAARDAEVPGLSAGAGYTLADVDAIEAARGKPYARLRSTVEQLATVTAERDRLSERAGHFHSCGIELNNATREAAELNAKLTDSAERHRRELERAAAAVWETAATRERDALLLGMVAAGEITPPAADRIAWSHGHVEPKAEDLAAIIAGVKLG